MTKYHDKYSCNYCGSINELVKSWYDEVGGDFIISEAETKCLLCGKKDYWAHGFFESSIDGYDNCEKY